MKIMSFHSTDPTHRRVWPRRTVLRCLFLKTQFIHREMGGHKGSGPDSRRAARWSHHLFWPLFYHFFWPFFFLLDPPVFFFTAPAILASAAPIAAACAHITL